MLGALTARGADPLAALAQSARVRRIAVVCDAGDNDSHGDISRFESRLGGALLKSGKFSLVDREVISKLIREQGFSNSAYADPKTASKLGKLAGAERFLFVQLTSKVESDRGSFVTTVAYHVSGDFKLDDVSTGSISSQGSADGDAQDKFSTGSGDVSTIALDKLRRQGIDACIDDLMQQLST